MARQAGRKVREELTSFGLALLLSSKFPWGNFTLLSPKFLLVVAVSIINPR
jgi:hypothetical protein